LGRRHAHVLSPADIRSLGQSIRRHFNLASDIEAGVEIDPRRITRDHITALREVGFNRASIGVQDFNPAVQTAVHRIQSRRETEQALEWARAVGFPSVNVDLIYGLPYQTVESFEKTLDEILELGPDRLAVFSYAHVPWMKPAQKILEQQAALPSAETKLNLLKLVIEKLTQNDRYTYIGMDHFARPADELAVAQRQKTLQRNFQGYSTKGGADIYAFACRPFRRPTASIGKTSRTCPLTIRPGFRPGAFCQRLPLERRRQNSPPYHHAPDVRYEPGLQHAFQGPGD